MDIYYENTDITEDVEVQSCIVRDTCGERCDSLEIVFENAAGWYAWGPKEDDQIVVSHNGYDSGIMYVNTILPEEGRFRIFATSLPCSARMKAYQSFEGNTIEEIVQSCAAVSGMDYQLYGIDGKIRIPYIQREDESAAHFLQRFLMLEGATLKCVNGKYATIGIEYAQDLQPGQTIELYAAQEGVEYLRDGQKLKSVTIETPFARMSVEDTAVESERNRLTTSCHPALDNVQAGRWARGILLSENRKSEVLRVQSEYNIGWTAMVRIDVDGDTDANGEWLIDEVEHDLINLKSTAKMLRCIRTIE